METSASVDPQLANAATSSTLNDKDVWPSEKVEGFLKESWLALQIIEEQSTLQVCTWEAQPDRKYETLNKDLKKCIAKVDNEIKGIFTIPPVNRDNFEKEFTNARISADRLRKGLKSRLDYYYFRRGLNEMISNKKRQSQQ